MSRSGLEELSKKLPKKGVIFRANGASLHENALLKAKWAGYRASK
jgi:hypothetical protein